MPVGPPSIEWLELSDERMAYTLLAWALEMAAEKQGVPVSAVDHSGALAFIRALAGREVDDVRAVALEKAIRKIVVDFDPVAGGKVFREFLLDGAQRSALERREAVRRARLSRNTARAAQSRTKYTAAIRAEWREIAAQPQISKLLSASDKARQIAGALERRNGKKWTAAERSALEQAIRKELGKK